MQFLFAGVLLSKLLFLCFCEFLVTRFTFSLFFVVWVGSRFFSHIVFQLDSNSCTAQTSNYFQQDFVKTFCTILESRTSSFMTGAAESQRRLAVPRCAPAPTSVALGCSAPFGVFSKTVNDILIDSWHFVTASFAFTHKYPRLFGISSQ